MLLFNAGQKLESVLQKSGRKFFARQIEDAIGNCEICKRCGRSINSVVDQCQRNDSKGFKSADNFGFICLVLAHYRRVQSFLSGGDNNHERLETILENLLQKKCLIMGFPRTIFTNNGGECENSKMETMAKNYNITLKAKTESRFPLD